MEYEIIFNNTDISVFVVAWAIGFIIGRIY